MDRFLAHGRPCASKIVQNERGDVNFLNPVCLTAPKKAAPIVDKWGGFFRNSQAFIYHFSF